MTLSRKAPLARRIFVRNNPMENLSAYLAAIDASEQLAEPLKEIQRDVVAPELADIALKLKGRLEKCGALTPHYSELLDGVPSEMALADAARAAGKTVDARAAMMRAVGKVNFVIAAFVGPRPEA